MSAARTLSPAQELVATFPNESLVYRTARNVLLVEEIELRRHIEHVASSGARYPIMWGFRTAPRMHNKRARCRMPSTLRRSAH
jgi:predicted dithiol-disulfide oxidoreductase (DUF899 family)